MSPVSTSHYDLLLSTHAMSMTSLLRKSQVLTRARVDLGVGAKVAC